MVKPAAIELVPPVIPAPFAAVQVNAVLGDVELKVMFIIEPLQTVSLETNVATAMGDGFTVIV